MKKLLCKLGLHDYENKGTLIIKNNFMFSESIEKYDLKKCLTCGAESIPLEYVKMLVESNRQIEKS